MNTARSRSRDFMQKACNFYTQQLPEMYERTQHTTYQCDKKSVRFYLIVRSDSGFSDVSGPYSGRRPAKRKTDGSDTVGISKSSVVCFHGEAARSYSSSKAAIRPLQTRYPSAVRWILSPEYRPGSGLPSGATNHAVGSTYRTLSGRAALRSASSRWTRRLFRRNGSEPSAPAGSRPNRMMRLAGKSRAASRATASIPSVTSSGRSPAIRLLIPW